VSQTANNFTATAPTHSRCLVRDQRTDGLAELAETLRTLRPPYRFHGELMHGALRDGQDDAIAWHLIQVLAELEQGT
jgi:hypothetical protein